MTDYPRERYLRDPHFAAMVDMMVKHIMACDYTPTEIREAAMLAAIIYEERKAPMHFKRLSDEQ